MSEDVLVIPGPMADASCTGCRPPRLSDLNRMVVTAHAAKLAANRLRKWVDGEGPYAMQMAVQADVDLVLSYYQDKVEGLTCDLFNAVETAFNRGAIGWAALNYAKWFDTLNANQQARDVSESTDGPESPGLTT